MILYCYGVRVWLEFGTSFGRHKPLMHLDCDIGLSWRLKEALPRNISRARFKACSASVLQSMRRRSMKCNGMQYLSGYSWHTDRQPLQDNEVFTEKKKS